MFKNLFLILFIVISSFASVDTTCKRDGVLAPDWICFYYKRDYKSVVGIGKTLTEAKKNAKLRFRKKITNSMKDVMKKYDFNINEAIKVSKVISLWISPNNKAYVLVGITREGMRSLILKSFKKMRHKANSQMKVNVTNSKKEYVKKRKKKNSNIILWNPRDNIKFRKIKTINNLIWEDQNSKNVYTWYKARDYCSKLVIKEQGAIISSFRLPTKEELYSMIDGSSRIRPIFESYYYGSYWGNRGVVPIDKINGGKSVAWIVTCYNNGNTFKAGITYALSSRLKKRRKAYARCVRDANYFNNLNIIKVIKEFNLKNSSSNLRYIKNSISIKYGKAIIKSVNYNKSKKLLIIKVGSQRGSFSQKLMIPLAQEYYKKIRNMLVNKRFNPIVKLSTNNNKLKAIGISQVDNILEVIREIDKNFDYYLNRATIKKLNKTVNNKIALKYISKSKLKKLKNREQFLIAKKRKEHRDAILSSSSIKEVTKYYKQNNDNEIKSKLASLYRGKRNFISYIEAYKLSKLETDLKKAYDMVVNRDEKVDIDKQYLKIFYNYYVKSSKDMNNFLIFLDKIKGVDKNYYYERLMDSKGFAKDITIDNFFDSDEYKKVLSKFVPKVEISDSDSTMFYKLKYPNKTIYFTFSGDCKYDGEISRSKKVYPFLFGSIHTLYRYFKVYNCRGNKSDLKKISLFEKKLLKTSKDHSPHWYYEIFSHSKKVYDDDSPSSSSTGAHSFTCKFHCVGQWGSFRGGEYTVTVRGSSSLNAEGIVKDKYRATCAKYPFYKGGGSTASVGNVTCY